MLVACGSRPACALLEQSSCIYTCGQARPKPLSCGQGKVAAKGEASGSGAGAGPACAGRSPGTPAPATPAPRARAPPRAGEGTPGSEKTLTLSPGPSPCTPPARPRGPGDTTMRRNSGGAPARKGPSPAGYGSARDANGDSSGGACGSSSKQQGRRARRNAQRAAMDARGGLASP